MPQSLFEFGWLPSEPKDQKIYGVANGTVIDNIDLLGEGRVQVTLPWAPGYLPWARVATVMAGMLRGTYFIPMIGDEVLLAFNQGDIREPFVIGALWNTLDRPPSALPTDPLNKRIIRTPLGQQVVFDDLLQSVTINNTTLNQLMLGPQGAVVTTPSASVSLDVAGNVTITATTSITLNAPTINITGTTVTIAGGASATLNGGAQCTILGTQVDIG